MTCLRARIVLTWAAVALAGLPATAAAQGPTQSDLNAAATNSRDWLLPGHDYAGTRFVDLSQITRQNARSLRPICIHQTAYPGSFQVFPIVRSGVMYITAGASTIAIDASTCKLRWRHNASGPDGADTRNRGVALKDGTLVRGGPDGRLFALDAASGKLLWDVQVANPKSGEELQMPPAIFEDLVIIGPAGGESGVRGWVGAFRFKDGSPVWKFNTIPKPGDPGADTWTDPASPLIGGGSIWTPFSLDPARGIVYAAVANPAPDFIDDGRKGDNLYTNSVIAIDARTGTLKWHFQVTAHDLHDWDLTNAAPWFDVEVQGRRRNVIAAAGKEGFLTLIDRDTHERLWQVPVTTRENVDAPPTVDGVRTCPGAQGGVQWNGPAYNPRLNMLYTPAVDWCTTFRRAAAFTPRAGPVGWMGGFFSNDPYERARGWLTAVDASTGAVRWKHQSAQPMLAAVTTTSAGLLFTAEMTGDFLVLDARDGAELYRFPTGAPNNGGVVTYAVEGKQYVAVMSGDATVLWPTPPATGNVIVFAVP